MIVSENVSHSTRGRPLVTSKQIVENDALTDSHTLFSVQPFVYDVLSALLKIDAKHIHRG